MDQKLLVHSKVYVYFDLEVKNNQKFAIENYCESYHLPTVHSELNKDSNINEHYHIQGLPNHFVGQGSKTKGNLLREIKNLIHLKTEIKVFSKILNMLHYFSI